MAAISTNSALTIRSDVQFDASANTNLGANITAPQTFFSFAKADFAGGEGLIQTKIGANSQIYKIIFTHNGSDPGLSTYGVIAAPTTANNGVVVGASNTTHILIRYQQTAANTAVKASFQLVK